MCHVLGDSVWPFPQSLSGVSHASVSIREGKGGLSFECVELWGSFIGWFTFIY